MGAFGHTILSFFAALACALMLSCSEDGDDDEVSADGGAKTFGEKVEAFSSILSKTAAELKIKQNSVQPASDSPLASGSFDPIAIKARFGVTGGAVRTSYVGAVDPGADMPWYAKNDWSFYAHIVRGERDRARVPTVTLAEEVVDDNSLRAEMQANNNEVTWSGDKIYVLDGPVFVEDGETLTIQPGTVIKGRSADEPTEAASLVVARGGKILAQGTSEMPIIFTHEADPLDGSQTPKTRGRWGGLIILGKARLNTEVSTKNIEGIPTSEVRGSYGGSDDADSSGVLAYVSIRHGGVDIGAGNEINGLTLGGVGSRTIIENVEVIANKDDGVEIFGGTARLKKIIVAYCKDDSIDFDQGYRGFQQFIIIHQDSSDGSADRGYEIDGGDEPENGTPYGVALVLNLTSVGNPNSRAITFRDNAGGYFYNSVWWGYGRGVDVEDISRVNEDSFAQLLDGNIAFGHCVFSIGSGAAEGALIFARTVPEE